MPSISLNNNFYDFWVKFPESWYLFIPNLAQVISNFIKLLVDTFSFMKFTSIKILFIFSCLFIYINTWTKHLNSDSRIYHHSYNLIYHFPSFFEILTFININNIIRGFTSSPRYNNFVLEIKFLPVFMNNSGYFLLISDSLSHVTSSICELLHNTLIIQIFLFLSCFSL